jgi:hypothetical protein
MFIELPKGKLTWTPAGRRSIPVVMLLAVIGRQQLATPKRNFPVPGDVTLKFAVMVEPAFAV